MSTPMARAMSFRPLCLRRCWAGSLLWARARLIRSAGVSREGIEGIGEFRRGHFFSLPLVGRAAELGREAVAALGGGVAKASGLSAPHPQSSHSRIALMAFFAQIAPLERFA